MPEPSLRELRIALQVAATGSFRVAARRLDMAPSSLSHAIATLERTLGMRLFHRTTRSVAPTPEGKAFLARVEPLLAQLDVIIAAPRSDVDVITGVLRINVPFSAGLYLMDAIIPRFTNRYPLIEIELRHEERLVDIVAEGCDAGIRLQGAVPGDMIGVGFGGPLRWALVASPAYLQRSGEPAHPRDLLDHRCLRVRLPDGKRYQWELACGDEEFVLDVPGSLTLDRMALSVEAAARGLGIAYVLEHAAASYLRIGSLRIVLPSWSPSPETYMLYYPGRRAVPPQLRAFIETVRQLQRQGTLAAPA